MRWFTADEELMATSLGADEGSTSVKAKVVRSAAASKAVAAATARSYVQNLDRLLVGYLCCSTRAHSVEDLINAHERLTPAGNTRQSFKDFSQ